MQFKNIILSLIATAVAVNAAALPPVDTSATQTTPNTPEYQPFADQCAKSVETYTKDHSDLKLDDKSYFCSWCYLYYKDHCTGKNETPEQAVYISHEECIQKSFELCVTAYKSGGYTTGGPQLPASHKVETPTTPKAADSNTLTVPPSLKPDYKVPTDAHTG